MKKVLPVVLLFCAVALFAKTQIPTLSKVTSKPNKITRGPVGLAAAQAQDWVLPLDEPFTPEQVYSSGAISKNIVPINVLRANEPPHSCTAWRFRRNWRLTAARCVKGLARKTGKQRIYSNLEVQEKDMAVVNFSPATAKYPSNAEMFFYHEGTNNPRFPADDIVLIRLDGDDPALAEAQAGMEQAEAQIQQIQISDGPAAQFIQQAGETVQAGKRQLSAQEKLREDFLSQPLDAYRFLILADDQTGTLADRTATAVRFKRGSGRISSRKLPETTAWKYRNAPQRGVQTLAWSADDGLGVYETGSPLVINGIVVSSVTNPDNKRVKRTPLFTEHFRDFLNQVMGEEFSEELCVYPVPPEPAPQDQADGAADK